jgi:hypothetical protein
MIPSSPRRREKLRKRISRNIPSRSRAGLRMTISGRDLKLAKRYTARRKIAHQKYLPRIPDKPFLKDRPGIRDTTLGVMSSVYGVYESTVTSKVRTALSKSIKPFPSRPVPHAWTSGTAYLTRDYASIVQDGWKVISAFLLAISDFDSPSRADAQARGNPTQRGSRSLMDMCLGRLSRDMSEEQKQKDSNPSGFDGNMMLLAPSFMSSRTFLGTQNAAGHH